MARSDPHRLSTSPPDKTDLIHYLGPPSSNVDAVDLSAKVDRFNIVAKHSETLREDVRPASRPDDLTLQAHAGNLQLPVREQAVVPGRVVDSEASDCINLRRPGQIQGWERQRADSITDGHKAEP